MPAQSTSFSAAKGNIFSLSKEFSDCEKTIRSKMVVANIEGAEKVGEQVWQKDGFFGKINPDYSTHKNDFPENCLCYINQAYLTVKDRDTMIYCDYAILAQIVVFRSPPEGENVDELIKNDKKLVKIYMPMHDTPTGKFLGIKESVGYIMIHNQEDEVFLSYGYSSEHAAALYCYQKQPIPNIFRGTAFNSHKLSNYLKNKDEMLDICFYLPSTTDRKEDINSYKDMVSLIPVTSSIADINAFSPDGYSFNPKHLDEAGKNLECARETLYSYFKNVAKVSNSNLIQNTYALMKKKGIAHSSLKWAPSLPQAKVDYSKFSHDHS